MLGVPAAVAVHHRFMYPSGIYCWVGFHYHSSIGFKCVSGRLLLFTSNSLAQARAGCAGCRYDSTPLCMPYFVHSRAVWLGW